jgi:hypothetical protein
MSFFTEEDESLIFMVFPGLGATMFAQRNMNYAIELNSFNFNRPYSDEVAEKFNIDNQFPDNYLRAIDTSLELYKTIFVEYSPENFQLLNGVIPFILVYPSEDYLPVVMKQVEAKKDGINHSDLFDNAYEMLQELRMQDYKDVIEIGANYGNVLDDGLTFYEHIIKKHQEVESLNRDIGEEDLPY